MLRSDARGFTLVEMLTVIAIILILGSLSFPVYFSAVRYSHRSSCASNLHQIASNVELARQDGDGYPEMPGYVGPNGAPRGGIAGLAASGRYQNGEYLWCRDDRFPEDFPGDMWANEDAITANGLQRDLTASSYDANYNYYGYVTTTDGLPFPVTTAEAAGFFFGNPVAVDDTFPGGDPGWNLGLVDSVNIYNPNTKRKENDIRPHALFQGLRNIWAPQGTIVTFCPHHYEDNGSLIAVTLNGSALYLHPVQPVAAPGGSVGGIFTRYDNKPVAGYRAPVDWRVNKLAFASEKVNSPLFGDAPRNALAQTLPVVQTFTRRFRAADLETPPWFDTGIPVQPHDYLMVVATARWRGQGFAGDADYNAFANSSSRVWFTAEGDPVEYSKQELDLSGLTLPDTQDVRATHGVLIGTIGIGNDKFLLGSRGSYLVPSTAAPDSLQLAFNDEGSGQFDGWCEVTIALFRP